VLTKNIFLLYAGVVLLIAPAAAFSQTVLLSAQTRLIRSLSKNGKVVYRAKGPRDSTAVFQDTQSIKFSEMKFNGCLLSYRMISRRMNTVSRQNLPNNAPSLFVDTVRDELSLDLADLGEAGVTALSDSSPASLGAITLRSKPGKQAISIFRPGTDKAPLFRSEFMVLVKKDGVEDLKAAFSDMIALCTGETKSKDR
jgi:hypothetical protein